MQVLSLDTSAGALLIPVSMIAQILSRSGQAEFSHSLPFIRRSVQWREYRVPLVYSSELLGAEHGSDEIYLRGVVLWPLKGTGATDLFALTSLESPKVITIASDTVLDNSDDEISPSQGARDFIIGGLQAEGQKGYIPDLKLLASSIFQ
jgi:hypothetical protein